MPLSFHWKTACLEILNFREVSEIPPKRAIACTVVSFLLDTVANYKENDVVVQAMRNYNFGTKQLYL